MSAEATDTLGSNEISSQLGVGGMGASIARENRVGRDVAVKVLPEHLTADRDLLARFEKEARAASVLNHPNVVANY